MNVRTWHKRTCGFCGGEARVLAPVDADDLDVMAEFSGAAREFCPMDAYGPNEDASFPACSRCARKHRTAGLEALEEYEATYA